MTQVPCFTNIILLSKTNVLIQANTFRWGFGTTVTSSCLFCFLRFSVFSLPITFTLMLITNSYFYKDENIFVNKKLLLLNIIYLRDYLSDLMFISDYFIVLLTIQKSYIHVLHYCNQCFCQPVSAHARKIPNVNNNNLIVYTGVL